MRKFLFTFLLLLVTTLSAPVTARAGGSDTPFPLDFPLPFPWGTIEGTWQIESETFPAIFVFRVARNCENRQILKVAQLHPMTGEIMAEGIGYRTDESKTVYAAMSGTSGGSYILIVGAYKEKRSTAEQFYGLRLLPFGPGKEIRYRIDKVSNDAPRLHPFEEPVGCLTSTK